MFASAEPNQDAVISVVPYVVLCSDIVSGFGSGMTVKSRQRRLEQKPSFETARAREKTRPELWESRPHALLAWKRAPFGLFVHTHTRCPFEERCARYDCVEDALRPPGRFVPLFFKNTVGLTPIETNAIYVVSPLVMLVGSVCVTELARRRFGRPVMCAFCMCVAVRIFRDSCVQASSSFSLSLSRESTRASCQERGLVSLESAGACC